MTALKSLLDDNFEMLSEAQNSEELDDRNNWFESEDLRPIEEIPHPYQQVFAQFAGFNIIQSKILDDVLYTDNSLVVSAPTGSGKTAIFELAIIRLLIAFEKTEFANLFKIIYISPMKALCEERLVDWHKKFANFGINCISVTGDSDNVEFQNLFNHNLIITTPEKWDCLTRKWKDNKKLVQVIKLFMIDEVHLINEECRGSTLETIVCRMKTIEESVKCEQETDDDLNHKIRFVAVSATITNIEDIAEWIGKSSNAKYYKFSDKFRPVKLTKIVLGYPYGPHSTPFKFDLALNYKLQSLMMQYSHGKPTLIFCSTRKMVEMTAKHLLQHLTINLKPEQKQHLVEAAGTISDAKVKETLVHGVGYHHAGMLSETKRAIENLFRNSQLPVLVTTSTLAVGVNLPAHLVIIKSTKCYTSGEFRDYTETALMQMIGRAGRPQFDATATALILTTEKDRQKFEKMIGGLEPIESNLHRHLTEHLNAEVVLQTITDLDVAMRWLSSTFLYIRARKNPRHYGLALEPSSEQIDKKLLEICQIELNKLIKAGMLTIDQDVSLKPTPIGSLMAKYYLAFETMKLFTQMTGGEILQQILNLISKCHEFSEMFLRVNDKKCLNLLNKCRNRQTIRFPLSGKIKTVDMKINCIIQAVLGCLDICDHSILSETLKIMRNGERIVKCLIEYLESKDKCYKALLSTIILAKCFHVQLWENSPYVSKQLSGIGNVMSSQLVKAGKTSFEIISECDPRELELLLNKKPPVGGKILEQIQYLPKYKLKSEVSNKKSLTLIVSLENAVDLQERSTVNRNSFMHLLVGDSSNNILLYEKYSHSYMIEHPDVVKFIDIKQKNVEDVEAHFISEDWVGIDCTIKLVPKQDDYDNRAKITKQVNNKQKSGNNKLSDEGVTYMQKFMEMYMKCKTSLKQPSSIADSRHFVKENLADKEQSIIKINPSNNKSGRIENLENAEKILEETQNENKNNKIIVHSNVRIFNTNEKEMEQCDNDALQEPDYPRTVKTSDMNQENIFGETKRRCENDRSFAENSFASRCDFNSFVSRSGDVDRVFNTELKYDNGEIIKPVEIRKFKFAPKKLPHKRTQSEISWDSSLKDFGYLDAEQIRDKKPKNQNKISWRSPLTYSPPVKFSPKIDYSNLNAASSDSGNKMEKHQEASSVSSSNSIVTNPVQEAASKISTKPVCSFTSRPLIRLKSSKSGSFFPLSDQDFADSSIDEGYESRNKIMDDLHDFISPSLWENVGLINQKKNSLNQVKSPTSAEYYSQLLSQSQLKNDPEQKKEEIFSSKCNNNNTTATDTAEKQWGCNFSDGRATSKQESFHGFDPNRRYFPQSENSIIVQSPHFPKRPFVERKNFLNCSQNSAIPRKIHLDRLQNVWDRNSAPNQSFRSPSCLDRRSRDSYGFAKTEHDVRNCQTPNPHVTARNFKQFRPGTENRVAEGLPKQYREKKCIFDSNLPLQSSYTGTRASCINQNIFDTMEDGRFSKQRNSQENSRVFSQTFSKQNLRPFQESQIRYSSSAPSAVAWQNSAEICKQKEIERNKTFYTHPQNFRQKSEDFGFDQNEQLNESMLLQQYTPSIGSTMLSANGSFASERADFTQDDDSIYPTNINDSMILRQNFPENENREFLNSYKTRDSFGNCRRNYEEPQYPRRTPEPEDFDPFDFGHDTFLNCRSRGDFNDRLHYRPSEYLGQENINFNESFYENPCDRRCRDNRPYHLHFRDNCCNLLPPEDVQQNDYCGRPGRSSDDYSQRCPSPTDKNYLMRKFLNAIEKENRKHFYR